MMTVDRQKGLSMRQDIIQGRDIGAITFVVMAQSEQFDDVTITEHADLFVVWSPEWTGKVNTIVCDPDDGRLYRKINSDYLTPYPQSQPSKDRSQWKLIGDPTEEWPEWSQPQGAHDAYTIGDKVTHKGTRWISSYAGANIWEPGVYGWNQA